MKDFKNEPILDYTKPPHFKRQQSLVEAVRRQFGKQYPNIIAGKRAFTDEKTYNYNPANPAELIGIFQKAGKEQAEKAMVAANRAFESWRNVSPKERADVLFNAAQITRHHRHEINAWMIAEVGKNYTEADGDTAEAIDFMEFYAREALRYAEKQPIVRIPGEDNELFYIPLGTGVIIPPWNFPFAILVGMTSAAIVTGNTVVLKPSSESPMMGFLFTQILKEAGLPPGVLNYLVASGAEAGDYLVTHPKTRFVSFTGSMEVGLRVNELAARPAKGQMWIKRVIAEMGGKDAIIVADDANLDDAVAGVTAAAFGFQGQKCSACSRAIVAEPLYNKFIDMLRKSVSELSIGDPADNAPIGPVVSAKAQASILHYIDIGHREGRLIAGGKKVAELPGYFIEPTVFADVSPVATIMQEEIFGPVLAVAKARDFEHALYIANNTMFGLTGAIYSCDEAKLERARRDFHVGNLYLNRKCTGALVGVHPFGGFNMSGTDSKAGGRDYLQLFMQAKVVSRKTK